MILALAEKELLNRLTTKNFEFLQNGTIICIVLCNSTKNNHFTHEQEKEEVAKVVGTLDEYVRAWRKASRADEIASHGRAVSFARVHVSKRCITASATAKLSGKPQ